jgi:hypothetical protein
VSKLTYFLEVSPLAFQEIAKKMQTHGFGHQCTHENGRPTINMEGIFLVENGDPMQNLFVEGMKLTETIGKALRNRRGGGK